MAGRQRVLNGVSLPKSGGVVGAVADTSKQRRVALVSGASSFLWRVPTPVPDFRHVLTILADVTPMFGELVRKPEL